MRARHFSGRTKVFAAAIVSGAALLAAQAAETDEPRFTDQERAHWAFQPVVRPAVPVVRHADRVANPIDAFLLARLEPEGLTFTAPATKRDLIRRATFDLLGLPPEPEEIDRFLADEAPDAYERLIDRLLASPHYGEHWGRMWLDVVRYAETAGYNADPLRPNAWKYRDYVIRAFNDDLPYDEFVRQQLAGDELSPDDPQAVLATGYTLLWPDESNASNILLARQDSLNDLTGNVGTVFLGLSIGCAQCHDHKFDPIPQKDFYRLQAFFSGIVRRDEAAVGTTGQLVAYQQQVEAWMAETAPLRHELHAIELAARIATSGDRRMKFPAQVLAAIDTPPEERTAMQRQLAFWCERQIEVTEEQLATKLTPEQKQRRSELKKQLAEVQKKKPQPPGALAGMIVGELEPVPPATHVLAGGSYNKPLEEVLPGFLSILCGPDEGAARVASPHPQTSGRRTALAKWVTDPRNPLVPRVIVNRIWQGHFGRGLVENGNDFGTQTPPPSHPELLDWLTAEFLEATNSPPFQRGGEARAWTLKRLHRLIMSSSAYRQATDRRTNDKPLPSGAIADSTNRLYWCYPRRRLSAERIRDSLLSVAGILNPMVHGPSVWPELPPDFSKREAWKVSPDLADRRRRSVYIHSKRNLPYPLLEAFDLPDMHESCARRSQTTVAPQALMLLNSELILDYARSFAGRVLADNPHAELPSLVVRAYRLAFGRMPDGEEIRAAIEFIEKQQPLASERQAAGQPLVLPRGMPKFLDPGRAAAVVDFCHSLMNASEFVVVE